MTIEAQRTDHTTTNSSKITLFICLVLLFGRMVILQWYVSYFEVVTFLCVAYGLFSLAIWLNRNELQDLKLDKSFMVIFLAVGCLYSFILPIQFGIFLGLITIINFYLVLSGKLCFENMASLFSRLTIGCIAVMMMPLYFKVIFFGNSLIWPDEKAVVDAIFTANLLLVVLEEVIYRGMLWMLLEKLHFREHLIVFAQAILFWVSHLSYFVSDPATFWLWLPLNSALLGFIVWRSKSVTPSIVGHFLYNFFLTLVR